VAGDMKDFKELYTSSFVEHGPTAKGVGWQDADVQRRRFHMLMDDNQYGVASILDVGCGYGELVEFLNRTKRQWFNHVKYVGIDVVPEMIDVARARYQSIRSESRFVLSTRRFEQADVRDWGPHDQVAEQDIYDLVVCSGALRFHDMPEQLAMLDAMWAMTGKVLAFNTRHADAYLGDLSMILARFGSNNWRVRHDYGLDDMTVVVKR